MILQRNLTPKRVKASFFAIWAVIILLPIVLFTQIKSQIIEALDNQNTGFSRQTAEIGELIKSLSGQYSLILRLPNSVGIK